MLVNHLSLALSLIYNSSLSYKRSVKVQKTAIVVKVINLLYKEGFIRGFFYNNYKVTVFLKYSERFIPLIRYIKLISTSGRRLFISVNVLAKMPSNSGVFFLNTTKGIITDKKALEVFKIGGEVICKIL
jgi:small subunit ribosomal protein S8